MKTRWIVLTVLCCMTISHANAQIDKMLYNQWASMEFKQWQFEPDTYYYSKVRRSKRILGIKVSWDEPGNGYHDKGKWVPFTNWYIPLNIN